MELLDKLIPYLNILRGWILWVAEKIANYFTLDLQRTNMFLTGALSLWAGKKLFHIFYKDMEGRYGYWFIISAAIFLALKYLGVPS